MTYKTLLMVPYNTEYTTITIMIVALIDSMLHICAIM